MLVLTKYKIYLCLCDNNRLPSNSHRCENLIIDERFIYDDWLGIDWTTGFVCFLALKIDMTLKIWNSKIRVKCAKMTKNQFLRVKKTCIISSKICYDHQLESHFKFQAMTRNVFNLRKWEKSHNWTWARGADCGTSLAVRKLFNCLFYHFQLFSDCFLTMFSDC